MTPPTRRPRWRAPPPRCVGWRPAPTASRSCRPGSRCAGPVLAWSGGVRTSPGPAGGPRSPTSPTGGGPGRRSATPTPTCCSSGLAPAANGTNRTGRMFTGDSSGDVLYAALHRTGFAALPTSVAAGDGQALTGIRIVAAVRCAPPANKPTPAERATCSSWLERDLELSRTAAAGRPVPRRDRLGCRAGRRPRPRLGRAATQAAVRPRGRGDADDTGGARHPASSAATT